MNAIDLDGKRDFPFTTNVLKFMQDAANNIEKLFNLGGSDYILQGCVKTGGVISTGWMVLDGKVMPFIGGPSQGQDAIKITKTKTDITVAEGTRKEITYKAEIGTTTVDGWEFSYYTLNTNRIYTLQEAALIIKSHARKLSGIVTKEKAIAIHGWDMATTQSVIIPHNLPVGKIRSINIMIMNDFGIGYDFFTPVIGGSGGGSYVLHDSGIRLSRVTDGFFDSSTFDDTAIIRGCIYIKYEAQ